MEASKRPLSPEMGEFEGQVKKAKLDNVLVFCLKHPNYLFSTITELSKHLKLDHKKDFGVAACGLCDSVFDQTTDLSLHIKSAHRYRMDHKCPLCTYVPEKPSQLEEHRLEFHLGAPFYACDFCPADFNNTLQRKEHEKLEHRIQLEDFRCDLCSIQIRAESQIEGIKMIRHHFQNDHGHVIYYPCVLCDNSFGHWQVLLTHEETIHPNLLPVDRQNFLTKENLHICPFENCDFAAKWPRYLKHHVEKVHFKICCQFCSRKFLTEDAKNQHEKESHQEQVCKCMICGQNFLSEAAKIAHIEANHLQKIQESKPKSDENITQEIDENLSQKISENMAPSTEIILKKVEDSSSEEAFLAPQYKIVKGSKPFQCSLCLEVFKFHASLICHIRLSHENPVKNCIKMEPLEEFPCDFCPATFPDSDQRNWHTEHSHGIENFYPSMPKTKSKKVKLRLVVKKQASKNSKKLKKELLDMQKYSNENGYQMVNDVNPKIFQCLLCDGHKPVDALKKLQNHLTNFHEGKSEKVLHCLACSDMKEDRIFNSIKSLYQHLQSVHPYVYQPFRCFHCRFGTKSRKDLLKHKKSEHGTLPHFKCDHCGAKFFNLQEKENHLEREHENKDLEKKEVQNIEGLEMANDQNPALFSCSRCPDFPPSSLDTQLIHHFNQIHSCQQSGAQCHHCKILFASVQDLKIHVNLNHSTEFQRFRCDFCNFATPKKSHLKQHNITKHVQVPHFPCPHCAQSFFTQADLTFHCKKKHKKGQKEKSLICPKCFRKFKTMDLLCNHLKSHDGDDKIHDKKKFIQDQKFGDIYKCSTCDQECANSTRLIEHFQEVHLNLRPFKCEGCNLTFSRQSNLTKHQRRGACKNINGKEIKIDKRKPTPKSAEKKTELRFKCAVCALVCKSSYRLMDHYNEVHVGLRPFICDGCGMSFSRKSNMTKHQRKGACKGLDNSHDSELGGRVLPEIDSIFECKKCDKVFKYKQSYQQHMDRVHLGKKDHQCDECGQLFTQIHHLRRHRVKVHNQGEEIMPHACSICENRFVSMAAWRTHMRKYHQMVVTANAPAAENNQNIEPPAIYEEPILSAPEEPIQAESEAKNVRRQCPAEKCSFVTLFPDELADHVRLNHDDRPFQCKKCDTSFKKAGHLKAHDTEVHLGVRPHVCETCGFSFARKTNLLKHQRNNACPGKKVCDNDNIKQEDHEDQDDKSDHKFLCDQCDKSFKYRQSLQYHIDSVHLEKKTFSCQVCGKGFPRIQRLREHSQRIHGDALVEYPHTCAECGREFITNGAYKLHMRKFHSIIVTEEDQDIMDVAGP